MLLHINPLSQLLVEILGVVLLLRRGQLDFLISCLFLVFIQSVLQSLWEFQNHIDFVSRKNLEHEKMCAGLVA